MAAAIADQITEWLIEHRSMPAATRFATIARRWPSATDDEIRAAIDQARRLTVEAANEP
jgi:transposase